MNDMYQMIADEKELKWFFDHAIFKPSITESYSMVFVSRHKKLTKEEQATIGLTRSESEFLSTQVVKLKPSMNIDEYENKENWTFDDFIKHIRRFNVDKYAYTTALGEPIPEKTLAVIFYINPADDINVADEVVRIINVTKTALTQAMYNGKGVKDNVQQLQTFGGLDSKIKHLKAQCKGGTYWIDYDIDVPKWFKTNSFVNALGNDRKYYDAMKSVFEVTFGKGNFIIVDTSGGYHVLVRTKAIKSNPHAICQEVQQIYDNGVRFGHEEPYLDEKGNLKFECIINGSHQTYNAEAEKEVKEAVEHLQDLQAAGTITQREFKILRRGLYDDLKVKDNKTSIPGIPLPGTFQYGRPVTVLNKEDFE